MRFLIAAAALLTLAACGDRTPASPADTPAVSVPEEWRAQLTDAPRVARAYTPTEFSAMSSASTVSEVPNGVRISAGPGLGAFSAVLNLGAEASAEGQKALRLTTHVESGALQFVMTYNGFPAGYAPYNTYVNAGEPVTLYLPVDTNASPVLVVANGSPDGGSVGQVTSVELVTAP